MLYMVKKYYTCQKVCQQMKCCQFSGNQNLYKILTNSLLSFYVNIFEAQLHILVNHVSDMKSWP